MDLDVETFLETYFEDVKPVPSSPDQYRVSPCPSCGNDKGKLYINAEKGVFNCFVCGYGVGVRIGSLFKDMGANIRDYYIDGKETFLNKKVESKDNIVEEPSGLCLPSEYRLIIGNNSEKAKRALSYLRGRGVMDNLISMFKLGYCFDGKYNNRVIFPYYEAGVLKYFTGRDFTDTQKEKYMNPISEKSSFIFNFEEANKNRNLVIVVEGPFDILAIPNHSVCLLGKFASKRQKELLSLFSKIFVVLDNDALKNSYDLCNELFRSCPSSKIYQVKLPEGEDPGSLLGKTWEYIKEAPVYTPDDAMENYFIDMLNSF